MRCVHCNPDPDGKKQCDILSNSMAYDLNDAEYPEELVEVEGVPTCTKHHEWDWKLLGDPDDPENENYIMPENPNQLKMF